MHSPQAGSSLPARSRLAGYKVYNTAKWVSIMLVVRREGEDEGGGGGGRGRGEDEGEDEGGRRRTCDKETALIYHRLSVRDEFDNCGS